MPADRRGTRRERALSRRAAQHLASALDRGFAALLRSQTARSRRGRAEPPPADRLAQLQRWAARTEEAVAGLDEPLFREPRPIAPAVSRRRPLRGGGRMDDLLWPSPYRPLLPELAERYGKARANLRGAARLFLHAEPRPVALLLHGYMTGQYALEQRLWPVSWLFALGLDVGLFVLPLHGVRAMAGRRGPPPFPSTDPRLTNEGLRHVVGDLRDLTAWLVARGHPAVGAMGMSLGAYTTALATTAAPELAFAVLLTPLGSLADFARDHGRLGSEPAAAAAEHTGLDAVHRIVSPLDRQPLVPPERMRVLAGAADRITPRPHAERLAQHFGTEVDTFPGGHLLQLGRRAALDRMGAWLRWAAAQK